MFPVASWVANWKGHSRKTSPVDEALESQMPSVMPAGWWTPQRKQRQGELWDILSWGRLGRASEWPMRLHHAERWSESILGRRTSMFRDPLKPFGFWWLHGSIFTFRRWWETGEWPGCCSPRVTRSWAWLRKRTTEQQLQTCRRVWISIRTPISPSPLFPGVTHFIALLTFLSLSITHTHAYTRTHHSFPLPFDSRRETRHPFRYL